MNKPLSKINIRTLLRTGRGQVFSEPRPPNPQGRTKRIYHGSTHRQCVHLISRGLLYKTSHPTKEGVETFHLTDEGKQILKDLRIVI